MEKNAMVRLCEAVQQRTRSNIVTRVTGKTGSDHEPTVFVEIELPSGKIYAGSGKNQKEARQKAALKALDQIAQGNW